MSVASPKCQRLLSGNQDSERPRGNPEVRIMGRSGQRSFTSRARPTVHDPAQSNVRENHGNVTPADQQSC
jgi:hypothetical protein